MASVSVVIKSLCSLMKVITPDRTFIMALVLVMAYLIAGASFSPSWTATSLKRFFAFSNPACTVLFCTLNSFVTEVPSSKAWLATACWARTSSILPASMVNVCTEREPFSPMSASIGANTSRLPALCRVSRNIKTASLASVLSRLVNFLTSIPAASAYFAGSR